MNHDTTKPVLRKKIAEICQKLNIPAKRFDAVSIPKGILITETVIDLHCRPKYAGFIWERLTDGYEIIIIDRFPLVLTGGLIDHNEKIWLILEEEVEGHYKYWVYEGQIKTILRVLRKAGKHSEVYLAPKDFNWLICLNSDRHLVLSGKLMYDRLLEITKPGE